MPTPVRNKTSYALNLGKLLPPDRIFLSGFDFTGCDRYFSRHAQLLRSTAGWPRMPAELRRRGWAVNHKRVYRWMHQDNLLCLRRRKFVVTADSDHGLPTYPNLARALALTGLDQPGGSTSPTSVCNWSLSTWR